MQSLPTYLSRLGRIALVVAAIDLVSKLLATVLLTADSSFGSLPFRLAVVHNKAAAFGVSIGQYTWHVNVILTVLAIALVIPVSRDLTRLDAGAPIALGLIVGGALGNLLSLVASPLGVVDFIAIDHGQGRELVLNLADVAAYIGVVLLMRTGVAIVRAMRVESEAKLTVLAESTAPALRRVDVEVPRAVFVDGVRVRSATTGGPVVRLCADGRILRCEDGDLGRDTKRRKRVAKRHLGIARPADLPAATATPPGSQEWR